ncbi:hypothetical protein EMIHUDRAFT_438353 [Emiliania huxleyi CCMP1516]|uniref:Uncharacterized protein n=2 Tax=Emiliania huxleyi TaxID=2903 RepID=A0A0D3IAY8_EMIH1|nr:hypothetical protein EMIHUDRAFT_438353 [Emiliania huxleyi CCMP1516]EOD08423.1 hypothetical protein EMIHUDRAFT_438353 [Emiliania huxleyi CCMP1516]|eukprot:XP_005760852.1 hypothetical protein EMIHUDRAFT_438353 [Emiliania huxleyi CCMP1516]
MHTSSAVPATTAVSSPSMTWWSAEPALASTLSTTGLVPTTGLPSLPAAARWKGRTMSVRSLSRCQARASCRPAQSCRTPSLPTSGCTSAPGSSVSASSPRPSGPTRTTPPLAESLRGRTCQSMLSGGIATPRGARGGSAHAPRNRGAGRCLRRRAIGGAIAQYS